MIEAPAELWEGWKGQVVWDVGGHLGESLPKFLETFDRVESFEPASEAFAMLALDWVDNPRVRLHRVALSDHDGVLVASVREVLSQTGQLAAVGMGWDSFVPGVSSPQEDSLPWGKEIGTREVLCRSVDSLVSSAGVPDFIAVDTEGHEVQIVVGAVQLLKFGHTGFCVEFHSPENYEQLVKLFEEADYNVQTIRHPNYKAEGELWRSHGWIKATP